MEGHEVLEIAMEKAEELYQKHAGKPIPSDSRAIMVYFGLFISSHYQDRLILELQNLGEAYKERNQLLLRIKELESRK